MRTLQAYVSGALSSVPGKVRLEIFYEKIGDVCEEKSISAFIPHRDVGPELTPHKLYQTCMNKISESDLLIAYVGLPSIGVGMEVQRASHSEKDIVILYDVKNSISKPVMGCPQVVHYIGFVDFEDAFSKLGGFLDIWLPEQNKKEKSLKPIAV